MASPSGYHTHSSASLLILGHDQNTGVFANVSLLSMTGCSWDGLHLAQLHLEEGECLHMLTFTRSMQASIFSCSTAFRAWEMLVVLLLDMPSFILRPLQAATGKGLGVKL